MVHEVSPSPFIAPSLWASACDAEDLAAALAMLVPEPAAWRARAQFSDQQYQRVRLWGDERAELRLLCWLPGQSSSLHTHGDAGCAFRVLAGVATETRLTGHRTYGPGQTIVSPPGDHHQVHNAGPDPLVTLHLYRPALPVDAARGAAQREIAVIGGGFSGAATVLGLLQAADPDTCITWFESSGEYGRGQAYGPADDGPLLNVQATMMGWDPADPAAFARWAVANGLTADPGAFLPRRAYGTWLQQEIVEALPRSRARVRLRPVRVCGLSTSEQGGVVLTTADGSTQGFHHVVIANGWGRPQVPAGLLDVEAHPALWGAARAMTAGAVPRQARVLVVGLGLTSVDVLMTLRSQGHEGRLLAVSRQGELPLPHAAIPVAPEVGVGAATYTTADELVAGLKSAILVAEAEGRPWQGVFEAARAAMPRWWADLPVEERILLVTRWRSWWDRRRHRAPLKAIRKLTGWERAGFWERRAATPIAASPAGDRLTVSLQDRDGTIWKESFDIVVVATSPTIDPAASEDPLVHDLVAAGARPDPTGTGWRCTSDARLLRGVSYVGPGLRANLGEGTGVPELREAAARLVQTVASLRNGCTTTS